MNDGKATPSHYQTWRAVAVFLTITALKIAVFLALAAARKAEPFVGDNAVDHYLPIAHRMLSEGHFNDDKTRYDSKVPPGYPAFLVATEMLLPGKGIWLAVCLQIIGDFLVALLLFRMGILLEIPGAGWLAGIAWLLFPPELAISTWITAEALFTQLFILSIYFTIRSFLRSSTSAIGAGVVLGLATLVRGTTLYLPLFLLPLWRSKEVVHGKRKAILFLISMGCVIAPWTIRNAVVLQDPIIVAVGFGSAFRQGADPQFITIAGKRKNYPLQEKRARDEGIVKPATNRESEIDHWLLRLGLFSYQVRLRERPLSIVSFAAYKALRLWYGNESGSVTTQIFLGLVSLAILPLALWQLWSSRKAPSVFVKVTALVLLYFALIHWVSLPEYRYMHPVFPLLLLLASQRVIAMYRTYKQSSV